MSKGLHLIELKREPKGHRRALDGRAARSDDYREVPNWPRQMLPVAKQKWNGQEADQLDYARNVSIAPRKSPAHESYRA